MQQKLVKVAQMLALASLASTSLFVGQAAAQDGPNDSAWIQLFNPANPNLSDDWDIKITGSELNVDTRNTFRHAVVQGVPVLEINYENYTSGFDFGHIGYKHRPFSYYIVRVEYQFYGSQVAGNPGSWALQNNGIMHHSQSAASMGLNQDFPISLEAQLLGPANTGADNNSTMNLCTPGTAYYTNPTGGNVNTAHCTSAATRNRDDALAPNWATAIVEAHGDSVIHYYVGNFDTVFTFYRPVEQTGSVSGNTVAINNGTPITGGHILLQSESHGTRFRKVELLNLEGCMDETSPAYKSYFVKHDEEACTVGIRTAADRARSAAPMRFVGNSIRVDGTGRVTLELFDMRGNRVGTHSAQAPFQWTPATTGKGLHLVRAITPEGAYNEKMTRL